MWFITSLRTRHVRETIALAEPGAVRTKKIIAPSTPCDDHALVAVGLPGKLGMLLHKGPELIRFEQLVELRGRLGVHVRALRVHMHWQSLVRWHRSWHVPEQVLNRDGPPFFSLNAHRFFWVTNFLFIECMSSSAF